MKLFSLLLPCLFISTLSFCQDYQRYNGETPEIFVRRTVRTNDFAHPVLETDVWDSTHKTIIYFLPVKIKNVEQIIGYLMVPTNSLMTYRKILIDTFFQEGGPPKIESVFFANTDKDLEKELIVLSSCPMDHPAAGFVGRSYGTNIYDNPSSTVREYQLTAFKNLSDKLDGGFEGKRNKVAVKAEYKDEAKIRAALRRMGF